MKSLYGCTALLLALVAMAYLAGFRLNVTPSLPKGLYRLTTAPIRIGTPVFFCLESPDFIRLAAERGYAGSGACPGALRPLGKEVYGLPGDRIDFNQGQIKVNGRILVGSAAKSEDRQGRTMPASRLQPGLIPAGYALVLSLHHSGSFDSRYFGLVSLAALRPVKPVSTY